MADGFTAFAWVEGMLDPWLPAIDRLLEVPGCERVLVAAGPLRSLDHLPHDDRVQVVAAESFAATVAALPDIVDGPVLLLTAPVLLPTDGIDPALHALEGDLRVVSVSLLSNAAGHLSFPQKNRPTQYSYQGHDETTMTQRLRESDPVLDPAPIAAPAGAATLVSRNCLVMTKGPDDVFAGNPEAAVAEMVMRAGRRGLRAVLDPSTYVARLWEGAHWRTTPLDDEQVRALLRERHPAALRLHDAQRRRVDMPLGLVMGTARAKVRGLRILVDGSCLGPIENGTQVQTLALVEALARRDDVKWVGVGLGGAVPRYAERVLAHPDVRVLKTTGLRFTDSQRADVLHRPFQPTGSLPWTNWRKSADRVLITLQDLIAYGVGAYHDEPGGWLRYRRGIKQAVRRADGVVVISHDVDADLRRERLPLVTERTFVVENGTDHLRGDEAEEFPAELLARGWGAREFLVVLGANYAHKNRDVAIRVLRRLRERNPSLGLVLAGVAVAEGSSRVLESLELRETDGVVTLPDVTSEERNWLLRHAAICLYPTSNEGFGLVPFEAARFGTPTVFTRMGPLAEVLDGVPVAASSWDPEDLAAACQRLLDDPQLSIEQVTATLKCGDRYTWDETAARLVRAYRLLLAEPVR
ncbi:glycosyltransferase family 4 protein [Nocardioides anomalus]|uniref:Glycosyltransferase family 4 protein n=1 Tax=Nocardioides anomalus TaxID=2712223 RepID=A0A6G6WIB5_9ACTN|nr:glycosyltransferase [Nocardioides anomalus]QIG44800.1 glycosyltransferase family 4 protein [Nocardioides anomalus]